MARTGMKTDTYWNLGDRHKGKRPLGQPRSRKYGITEMDVKEIVRDSMDRNNVAWPEKVAGCCEHGNEHTCVVNCEKFLDCLRNI